MKNKKIIIAIVAVFIAIMLTFAACKKDEQNGQTNPYVTDENGETITDINGEPITIIPESEIITVTDENGNAVTNAQGEVETSIYYKPQQVVVPVTDSNHQAVTGPNGEVLTTMIWFPSTPTTTVVGTVNVTDSNGNAVTDSNGNNVTATTIISSANDNFSKTMGGSGSDEAIAVTPAADGGVYSVISGTSKDGDFASIASTGGIGVAINKYDKEGKIVWNKAFGGENGVIPQDAVGTKDGGIVVVGYTKSNDFVTIHGDEYDAFIMKLDKDGNVAFKNSWGGSSNEDFYSVAEAPDGTLYAAGFAYSHDGDTQSLAIPENDSRAIVVKYSSSGSVVTAAGFLGFGDYFTDIAVAKNGDVFAVASMNPSSTQTQFAKKGNSDAVVYKFDNNLGVKFGKSFGGSQRDRFEAITPTADGGCIIAGASTSSDGDYASAGIKNKGGEDAVIVKFSGSGSIVFITSFYGNKDEAFKGVTVTPQGYIIATGEAQSATRDFATIGNKGGKDAFVVRFDSNGTFQSAIGIGGNNDDIAKDVCILNSGVVVIAGSTKSSDNSFASMTPKSDGTNSVGFIKTVLF